jgi:tight adherence protein C
VFLLLIIGVALVATIAALIGRAVALPRLRAMDHLGRLDAYGFGAGASEERPQRPLSGALDGVARRLGSLVEGRIKGLSEAETRRALMAAGLYRTPPIAFVGYRVLSAVCLPATVLYLLASAGVAGPGVVLAVLIGGAFGWAGPMAVVRRRARSRLERIDEALPELVDLLVVTVEAGMGLAGSLQLAAARLSGPLGDELRLAMQEQSMGLPTDEALANVLTRSDSSAMRSFVRSLRQGEALGVSIGQIMRALAVEMRKRRRAAAEERAQKAPVKMLFPLVALIFPALFIVLLTPAVISLIQSFGGGS